MLKKINTYSKNASIHFFNTCFYIKGYNRCLIYDLDRKKMYFIDLEMIDFIEKINNKPIDFIINEINNISNKDSINEWLNYLFDLDIYTFIPKNQVDAFPKVSTKFEEPYLVSNVVIRINRDEIHKSLINFLEKCNCEAIQIQILYSLETNEIIDILNLINKIFNGSGIKHIEVLINLKGNFLESILISSLNKFFLNKKNRINFIYLGNFSNQINEEKLNSKIILNKNSYINGILDENERYISSDIKVFFESQNFNVYHNKKIIFENNNLYRSDKKLLMNFTNHQNDYDLFKKIINQKENIEFWEINKEKTIICSSCEFRFNCVDKNIPKLNKQNQYYFEIECNYNPYISKWKDEDGYKTLAECGVISNENGFSIDHDKIAEINKVLWGE